MTITTERYTKNGEATVLEFGTGGGQYYVKLDDAVLLQASSYRPVWARGLDARAFLVSAGWRKA